MYDRGVKPAPGRPYSGFTYRVHTLLGTTGLKMAKYRTPIWDAISSPFRVVWRPHLLLVLIYEACCRARVTHIPTQSCFVSGRPVWLLDRHQCTLVSRLHHVDKLNQVDCTPRSPSQSSWASLVKLAAMVSDNSPLQGAMQHPSFGTILICRLVRLTSMPGLCDHRRASWPIRQRYDRQLLYQTEPWCIRG